ncbi:MAG: hypothetical protein DWQ04_19630 [Chloroflexi bacterium]|nr:MAG: hypothetical protein DWQ04_19630 [Chloroflexota bacterium]
MQITDYETPCSSLVFRPCHYSASVPRPLLRPLTRLDFVTYRKVPQKVIDLLLGNNMLPYEIYTQSPVLTAVLSSLSKELDVKVVERPVLPMVNEAKAAMFEHIGRDFS